METSKRLGEGPIGSAIKAAVEFVAVAVPFLFYASSHIIGTSHTHKPSTIQDLHHNLCSTRGSGTSILFILFRAFRIDCLLTALAFARCIFQGFTIFVYGRIRREHASLEREGRRRRAFESKPEDSAEAGENE